MDRIHFSRIDDDLSDEKDAPQRMSVYAALHSIDETVPPGGPNKITAKSDKEREKIKKVLNSIYIFRHLDETKLNEIIGQIYQREIKKGEIIMHESDPPDNFYIVKNGVFEAIKGINTKDTETLETYKDRGYFGELALLYDKPRCATIKSLSKGELWVLDGKVFRNFVRKHAFAQRERYEKVFENCLIFNIVSKYDKSKLSDSITTETYKAKSTVFEAGSNPGKLFIVESGEITLIKNAGGKETKVKLGKSDCFGGESIFKNETSNYKAQVTTDSKLMILTKDSVKAFLEQHIKKIIPAYEDYIKKLKWA